MQPTKKVQVKIDPVRQEKLDPRPHEAHIETQPGMGLQEMVERFFQQEEIRRELVNSGYETLEEADDFDMVEDTPDFVSKYEYTEMPLETFLDGAENQEPTSGEQSAQPQQGATPTGDGTEESNPA